MLDDMEHRHFVATRQCEQGFGLGDGSVDAIQAQFSCNVFKLCVDNYQRRLIKRARMRRSGGELQ
jgi:hypothetical protein